MPPETAQFVLKADDTIVSHRVSNPEHWFFQNADLSGKNLRLVLCRVRPEWDRHLPACIAEMDTPIFLPEAVPGIPGVVLALRRLRHEGLTFVAATPELAPAETLKESGLNDFQSDPSTFAKLFLRLRSVESRLDHYVSHLPGVIFHQRADLSYAYVGSGCEALLGVSRESLVRESNALVRLIHPADERSYYQELDRNADANKPFSLVYRTINPQTNTCTYVLDVRSPVRADSGLLLGYEGVWLDITRQKIAEHRLTTRAWRETFSTLTTGLLDDFSNIMTGMVSMAELYHHTLPPKHPLEEGLRLIQENAGHAQKLVRKIIELNRDTTGDRSYADLGKVIRDQRDLLKIILPRGTQITVAPEEGDWPVFIDEAGLRQTLVNLAMNSRDAFKDSGEIRIFLRRINPGETPMVDTVPPLSTPKQAMIELVFADNGAGVTPSHLARIFDPFFSTKETNRGAGLGLYHARLFAEAHGGHIAVRSTLGRGTEIVLLLPLADLTVLAAGAHRAAPVSEKRIRLLVLDPENTDDAPLVETLRAQSWDVRTVSTAEHARRILREEGVRLDGLIVRAATASNELRVFLAEIRRDHQGLPIALWFGGRRAEDLSPALRTQVDLVLPTDIADHDAVASLVKLLRAP